MILDALTWINHLVSYREAIQSLPHNNSFRVFAPEESRKIPIECRSMIYQLEQGGILNPLARELVIHQLIALEAEVIDLAIVKLVTLLVLASLDNERNLVAASAKFANAENCSESVH
jgi:Smg protein